MLEESGTGTVLAVCSIVHVGTVGICGCAVYAGCSMVQIVGDLGVIGPYKLA